MSAPAYQVATIAGVGLLGGSLGLALKARGLAGEVRGAGHRQGSLDKALAVGAIDTAYLNLEDAARDADLVLFCTPAALVTRHLEAVLPLCAPQAVLTDVASTKALLCRHAAAHCPRPRRFVGSHPMAGSEKFGPEYASADFYEGSVAFVEEAPDVAADARDAVVALWEALGARVVPVDPVKHDAMVAQTSHLPHVAAAILVQALEGDPAYRPFIGNGFRDATRIAGGRPEIWRDICLTNRDALLDALDGHQKRLEVVREAIAQSDGDALRAFFEAAVRARAECIGE